MSNDIPAVSVIIPVYNAAEFLKDGLNSLLKQTLREIEIICVDDGSTDGSLVILKEFEKADARIRVIHQENQGAGAARNNGMDVARGKYLAFLDADDFFEKNTERKKQRQKYVCLMQTSMIIQRKYTKNAHGHFGGSIFRKKSRLQQLMKM